VRLSDPGLATLAPQVAAAITGARLPDGCARLDPEDTRVLVHLRARIGRWLERVDHVPPADLVEQLLPETAYAFELRGPRRQQAWENLKKMRGLVRRIQNRGYATLPRIADHIDDLTAGDESNAVLEALDAVNLMTVHASKGLEFPVVFVVNVAKGASGPPRPVRVTVDGDTGEPSVSIGPFVSDTDEAERDREKQETRRLLYVALTRARDRLYLSAALKDGALVPGRGSLAEVLPDSLRQLFTHAATAFDACPAVAWTGSSGRPFEFRLCRPPAAEAAPEAHEQVPTAAAGVQDRFGAPAVDGAVRRLSVSRWLDESGSASVGRGAPPGDALAGTLVHRLFQRGSLDEGSTPDEDETAVRALLRAEERASVPDPDDVVRAAASAWGRMRTRDDVRAVLAAGERWHEVPFSMARRGDAPTVLRGTIDCLVRRPDGSVIVVEFKTGRRRESHQRQLDLYVEAARALYPGARVEGVLLYA
jgi:ATP-dependent helicase/nuclease subunit A